MAVNYGKGEKVRVEMTVRISGSERGGDLSTTQVVEADGAKWTHYVFLQSPLVMPSERGPNYRRVAFDAVITGDASPSRDGTTEVRELRSNGFIGFTHFLFLPSSAITNMAETTTTTTTTTKKERSTMNINGYSTTIEKTDVENRIAELEDQRGYDVVRLRNGEVIEEFEDEAGAKQFIEDEDYNPERVIVRRRDLDNDDTEELRKLRKLIEDVSVDADWTLYNDSYFDSSWAQERAREVLGLSYRADPFGDWPLSLIDWNEAASEQRDVEYPYSYNFDGTYFYAED